MNRPYTQVVGSAVGADSTVGAWVCAAVAPAVTVGNSVARWARADCWATRRPAVAAAMSGLALSERSISPLSGGDWNTDHHWPGMSSAVTTRCASPPGMPAETRFIGPSSGR